MDVRSNRFLELFTPGGQERLIGHLIYQELEDGQYLFREGDRAEGICLVLEGQIESVKATSGRGQTLAVFNAGDFLGEVAVLDGQGRSTDARTRGRASVAWIPTADLLDVLMGEPVTVTINLIQNVLVMLRRTNELYVAEVVRKEKMTLLGEMAGALMHDLRNPVQVLLSSVDLIKMTHPDDDTQDYCARMQLQCDRLIAMAGELLEFSRGEAKLHLVHTDTVSLLRQFLSFNEETFRRQGVVVDLDGEPADIEVDTMRLLRALQNLVTNAAHAVAHRPEGRVDVRAWVADSVLNISVRDNGPGIAAQVRKRLFEPFVTHGKTGGTGLGLAIVKNVVLAHRGTVAVETQPGQGTEFLLRLPQDAQSPAVE